MLVEIAVGDAYGLGFEFAPEERFIVNDLTRFLPHGLHPIPPGNYSDDTQMALAVAEVMIAKGATATREDFAEAFVRAFKRDPRLGYAKGFHALLSSVETGAELLARIKPASTRGGAAMRVAPVGLLNDEKVVLRLAEVQARITHDTPQGVESAKAVALAVHYASRGVARVDLRGRLVDILGDTWKQPYEGGPVEEDGITIVNAALTAVEMFRPADEILAKAVSFMGDTDTVAAIAMGIASVAPDFVWDGMVKWLAQGVENGPYGRDHLASVDRLLLL